MRGGSYWNESQQCRTAYRNHNHPANGNRNNGFRLAAPFQLTDWPDGSH